ncbi:MAG: tetratricopeptide repeat protein [Thermoanaerobaculia bacterium]
MRANVFTDKALERYAGRFVWLAVDTEKADSANFIAKYPINVWPTLLIVDPRKEQIALRYVGGATVPQLEKLLDDGARQYGAKSQTASDKLMIEADQLAGQRKSADAAKLYARAIAQAPKQWSRLGRAAEAFTFAAYDAHDYQGCADAAIRLLPALTGTVSGANVASTGLGCATELDEKSANRTPLIEKLERATRAALDNPKIPLSGDDRSGLYDSLVSAREAMKDDAGAQAMREQWAAFLESVAAKAKTAEQRAVYDSHRVSVYIDLKTPEKAIPMLEQSERDFPNDYNPPARLGLIYRTMKEYDKALAAYDRALELAYGPRKISIMRGRADTLAGKGDKEGAQVAMKETITFAKSLPESQRSDRTIAALEKRLTELTQ